jgi:hypothetical protein
LPADVHYKKVKEYSTGRKKYQNLDLNKEVSVGNDKHVHKIFLFKFNLLGKKKKTVQA